MFSHIIEFSIRTLRSVVARLVGPAVFISGASGGTTLARGADLLRVAGLAEFSRGGGLGGRRFTGNTFSLGTVVKL